MAPADASSTSSIATPSAPSSLRNWCTVLMQSSSRVERPLGTAPARVGLFASRSGLRHGREGEAAVRLNSATFPRGEPRGEACSRRLDRGVPLGEASRCLAERGAPRGEATSSLDASTVSSADCRPGVTTSLPERGVPPDDTAYPCALDRGEPRGDDASN